MFLHYATCQIWSDDSITGSCTCPRPWKIRKDREPANLHEQYHCWRVFRRDDDGIYEPVMRANSMDKALSLVTALISVADRYRLRGAFRGCL